MRDTAAAGPGGSLWPKHAYEAMQFAASVSDLPITDALAEPRYRGVLVRLAQEVLAAASVPVEPFDGFDPGDLDGSIDRLVELERERDPTPSEEAILAGIGGPLLARTLELVGEVEAGRRARGPENLELLAAYLRLRERAPALNAVIAELKPGERAAAGPLLGRPVAVKDNIDVRGVVTTNASTVAVPPSAAADAPVVERLRAAGADLLCKTNLLEYAAGSVNPAYGMTFNPRDPSRTSGGSSSGSAALVAAGVVDYALGTDTGGSIRIPAAYCGIVGLKPSFGLVPVDGVFPLSPSCDHVGTLTATAEQAATLLAVLADRQVELGSVEGLRIGALRRQLDDPDLEPGVRDRVYEALDTLAGAGFEVVDVDVPELDLADAALGDVVLREAWEVHRTRYELEADGYGPGTRALLELGAQISDERYRSGLAAKERIAAGFARVFEQVDVLAGPTVAYPAPPEDPPFGTAEGDVESRYTGPYNLAGVPAVSLSCGPAERALPAGLQLASAHGKDALLLSVARAYEGLR